MAKLTLTDIAAGYALITTYNANNALIEAALENTLSRDGTTPNTMSADLDMNSQRIVNMGTPVDNADVPTKEYIDDIVNGIQSAGDFSAANPYEITGAWDFTALIDFEGGIRVADSLATDYFQFVHDGTDLNVTQSGTTDVNFPSISGQYRFSSSVFAIGSNISALQLDEASSMRMSVAANVGFITGAGNVGELDISGFTSLDVNAGVATFADQITIEDNGLLLSDTTADNGNTLRISNAAGDDFAILGINGAIINLLCTTGTLNQVRIGSAVGDLPIQLYEAATPAPSAAGYGQIWIESATPNLLRFTDDASTDFDVAVSSATTGGTGSAGAGNQYVELSIGGVVYKVLHDGTV